VSARNGDDVVSLSGRQRPPPWAERPPVYVSLCKMRRRRGQPQTYEVWRWEKQGGALAGVNLNSGRLPLDLARAWAKRAARERRVPFYEPPPPCRARVLALREPGTVQTVAETTGGEGRSVNGSLAKPNASGSEERR
jgi:hypothetical protein